MQIYRPTLFKYDYFCSSVLIIVAVSGIDVSKYIFILVAFLLVAIILPIWLLIEQKTGKKYGKQCMKYLFQKRVEIHVGDEAKGDRREYLKLVRDKIIKTLESGNEAVIVAHTYIEVDFLNHIPNKSKKDASLSVKLNHLYSTARYKVNFGGINVIAKIVRVHKNWSWKVYHYKITPSVENVNYLKNLDVDAFLDN